MPPKLHRTWRHLKVFEAVGLPLVDPHGAFVGLKGTVAQHATGRMLQIRQ